MTVAIVSVAGFLVLLGLIRLGIVLLERRDANERDRWGR